MTDETYNLGLALSGGGAKGFAHLGVIQALIEKGDNPDIISGTSAGALAGVFIADGYTPEEVMEIFTSRKKKEFVDLTISYSGISKMTHLSNLLKKYIRAKSFEDLSIPLYVITTDFDNGEIVGFSKGKLIDPIIASCSVPIIFTPVVINGVHYVDGGLLKNLPASVIRPYCNQLIAINLNPLYKKKFSDSLKGVAERSLQYLVNSNVEIDKTLCDMLIEPNLREYTMFDLEHANKIFQIGYNSISEYYKKNNA